MDLHREIPCVLIGGTGIQSVWCVRKQGSKLVVPCEFKKGVDV